MVINFFYHFRPVFDFIGVAAAIAVVALAIIMTGYWAVRTFWKVFAVVGLAGGLFFIMYLSADGFNTIIAFLQTCV